MRMRIPFVEAPDDRNFAGIRSPYAEGCSRLAVLRSDVGAELFVGAVVAAFVKEIKILIGEKAGRAHGGYGFCHRETLAPASVPDLFRLRPAQRRMLDFQAPAWVLVGAVTFNVRT